MIGHQISIPLFGWLAKLSFWCCFCH